MRRIKIGFQTLLILSVFNFVLAAPVAVREIKEVDRPNLGMTASEKRFEPDDQLSTNAGYLVDEPAKTSSSGSTASSSPAPPDLDTATSKQPLSTGSQLGSSDDPPSNPGRAPGSRSPSHLVATDDTLSSYSVATSDLAPVHSMSTGYSPPLHLVSADGTLPSYSVSTGDVAPVHSMSTGYSPPSHLASTDDQSPPSSPGAPKSENFLGKVMKGKFERRISGYGPGNVVQRKL